MEREWLRDWKSVSLFIVRETAAEENKHLSLLSCGKILSFFILFLPVVTVIILVIVSVFVAKQIRVLPVLIRLIVHVVDPESTVQTCRIIQKTDRVHGGTFAARASVRGRTAAGLAAHQTENKM